MFLDIVDMIFDGIRAFISAFDDEATALFTIETAAGDVSVTFWHLILGLFVVGVFFSFFLAPRPGSVFSSVANLKSAENSSRRRSESDARRSESDARRSAAAMERIYRNSYEGYRERRARNEAFARRYNSERRRK